MQFSVERQMEWLKMYFELWVDGKVVSQLAIQVSTIVTRLSRTFWTHCFAKHWKIALDQVLNTERDVVLHLGNCRWHDWRRLLTDPEKLLLLSNSRGGRRSRYCRVKGSHVQSTLPSFQAGHGLNVKSSTDNWCWRKLVPYVYNLTICPLDDLSPRQLVP